MEENISKSTISRTLRRYRAAGICATKSPTGRSMKQKNALAKNKIKN